MQERWQRIRHFLQDKEKILITTHLNPDGDALGSELALAHYLKEKGHKVLIINSDPLPTFFEFLTDSLTFEHFDASPHTAAINSCDGCIIVDVSEWKRLGAISGALRESGIPIACIDHHLTNGHVCGVQVIDNGASSTGELIYDFLKSENANFTQEILDGLYTCILTDTGSFRFANTTPRTHLIAADLMSMGARFQKIYSELYENESKSRVLLKGHLLANMQFDCDGRFAWFVMPNALLKKLGAADWEAEGFSDLPRSIRGVEMSIMFSEKPDGLAKASFRSKGDIPINSLAEQFGGGGHKYAAGASLDWILDEAIPRVTKAAVEYLKNYSR